MWGTQSEEIIMPDKEIQSSFPPADAQSWTEYSWKMQQDVPNRFEDAAKFLATIISLTITLFFTAIEKLKLIVPDTFFVAVILLVWLSALGLAFFVLVPFRYEFVSNSHEAIKRLQRKIVAKKKNLFLLSTCLYFIPFLLLVIQLFITNFK